MEFLETNKERVRLPHQIGLEYARNRSSVIIKQVNNCKKVQTELRKIRSTYIDPKSEHPYLSPNSAKAYESILEELEGKEKEMEKLVGSDTYLDRILTVFEGRIGKAPTPEDLANLEKEAKDRFDKNIPPGFADVKKGMPEAAGDYVAWKQLMEIAREERKGIILVIDDNKEDWWRIEGDRTVGPLLASRNRPSSCIRRKAFYGPRRSSRQPRFPRRP